MDQLARMRNLANVVNLSTPLGIALAALGRGRLRRVGTLIVAESARLPFLNASAMTVGSVVLAIPVGLAFNGSSTPLLAGVALLIGLALLLARLSLGESRTTA